MTRILIAEDEPRLAAFLEKGLRAGGFSTTVVADGLAASQLARDDDFDLLILDLGLPGRDGLDVLRDVRAAQNKLPVIILTARGDDIDKIVGLEIGADDYVTKPFNPRELVARVKAVLRRSQGSVQPESVLEVADIRLDPARREVSVGGSAVQLRAKEFDLLAAFMRHQGVVLDRERLLSLVWGQDFYGDTRTIDVHVAWLREKLSGAKARVQTVWGVGYKLVLDEEPVTAKP